jgi:hypothetical protein
VCLISRFSGRGGPPTCFLASVLMMLQVCVLVGGKDADPEGERVKLALDAGCK